MKYSDKNHRDKWNGIGQGGMGSSVSSGNISLSSSFVTIVTSYFMLVVGGYLHLYKFYKGIIIGAN